MAQDKKYISPTLLSYFLEKCKSLFAQITHDHNLGNNKTKGFTKLYTNVGSNEDGAITQKALTSALNEITIVTVQQIVIRATLKANNWKGTTAPFKQTVSGLNVLETDVPTVGSGLIGSESASKVSEYSKAFNMLFAAETNDGNCVFSASSKPKIDFDVVLTFNRVVTKNNNFGKAVINNIGFGNELPASGINYGYVEPLNKDVLISESVSNFLYGDISINKEDTNDENTLYVGRILE